MLVFLFFTCLPLKWTTSVEVGSSSHGMSPAGSRMKFISDYKWENNFQGFTTYWQQLNMQKQCDVSHETCAKPSSKFRKKVWDLRKNPIRTAYLDSQHPVIVFVKIAFPEKKMHLCFLFFSFFLFFFFSFFLLAEKTHFALIVGALTCNAWSHIHWDELSLFCTAFCFLWKLK